MFTKQSGLKSNFPFLKINTYNLIWNMCLINRRVRRLIKRVDFACHFFKMSLHLLRARTLNAFAFLLKTEDFDETSTETSSDDFAAELQVPSGSQMIDAELRNHVYFQYRADKRNWRRWSCSTTKINLQDAYVQRLASARHFEAAAARRTPQSRSLNLESTI